MEIAKPTKAKKATFKLGSLVLDGYQLPDGSYRLSQTQVCSVLNKTHKSVGEFLEGNSLQALPHKSSSLQKIQVEGVKNVIGEVTLEIASAYWFYWALKGDALAQALAQACLEEALERRLDSAFNVERTERYYNDRLELRIESSIKRIKFTDAIAHYLETYQSYNLRLEESIQIRCANYLNRCVLGFTAKDAKNILGLKSTDLLRDFIPEKALEAITTAEDLASKLILDEGMAPFEAMITAIERAEIQCVGLK